MKPLTLLLIALILTACQPLLSGDAREHQEGLIIRNLNTYTWTNVRLILDGNYICDLDSISAGTEMPVAYGAFHNPQGQPMAKQNLDRRSVSVYASEGVLTASW